MLSVSNSKQQKPPQQIQPIAPSIVHTTQKLSRERNTIGGQQVAVQSERSHVPTLPHLIQKLDPNQISFAEQGDRR